MTKRTCLKVKSVSGPFTAADCRVLIEACREAACSRFDVMLLGYRGSLELFYGARSEDGLDTLQRALGICGVETNRVTIQTGDDYFGRSYANAETWLPEAESLTPVSEGTSYLNAIVKDAAIAWNENIDNIGSAKDYLNTRVCQVVFAVGEEEVDVAIGEYRMERPFGLDTVSHGIRRTDIRQNSDIIDVLKKPGISRVPTENGGRKRYATSLSPESAGPLLMPCAPERLPQQALRHLDIDQQPTYVRKYLTIRPPEDYRLDRDTMEDVLYRLYKFEGDDATLEYLVDGDDVGTYHLTVHTKGNQSHPLAVLKTDLRELLPDSYRIESTTKRFWIDQYDDHTLYRWMLDENAERMSDVSDLPDRQVHELFAALDALDKPYAYQVLLEPSGKKFHQRTDIRLAVEGEIEHGFEGVYSDVPLKVVRGGRPLEEKDYGEPQRLMTGDPGHDPDMLRGITHFVLEPEQIANFIDFSAVPGIDAHDPAAGDAAKAGTSSPASTSDRPATAANAETDSESLPSAVPDSEAPSSGDESNPSPASDSSADPTDAVIPNEGGPEHQFFSGKAPGWLLRHGFTDVKEVDQTGEELPDGRARKDGQPGRYEVTDKSMSKPAKVLKNCQKGIDAEEFTAFITMDEAAAQKVYNILAIPYKAYDGSRVLYNRTDTVEFAESQPLLPGGNSTARWVQLNFDTIQVETGDGTIAGKGSVTEIESPEFEYRFYFTRENGRPKVVDTAGDRTQTYPTEQGVWEEWTAISPPFVPTEHYIEHAMIYYVNDDRDGLREFTDGTACIHVEGDGYIPKVANALELYRQHNIVTDDSAEIPKDEFYWRSYHWLQAHTDVKPPHRNVMGRALPAEWTDERESGREVDGTWTKFYKGVKFRTE